jgi:hypothetical protein
MNIYKKKQVDAFEKEWVMFLSIMFVWGMFHFARPLIATTKDNLIILRSRIAWREEMELMGVVNKRKNLDWWLIGKLKFCDG